MRVTRFSLVLVLALLGLGCRSENQAAIESKCDAALRLRAEELARTDTSAWLDVLGRTTGAIDDPRRRQLEKAGARLGQVTEDLFTARIMVKDLGEVAALDFVKSLALSQTRQPLGP